MGNNSKTVPPFGMKDKVGYLFGNIANDFTFIFASLYLQVFYTDVLGINPTLVGTMFLLSRVVDAFTDTAMGRIADKAKATKNGKFKPWLLRACGPVGLASFLMYQTFITDASMTVRVVYMFATYLLWGSICYTAINIPYGSMASVMSNEADDRAALSTFRGVGSLIPQIIIGVVFPSFLYTEIDGVKVANAEMFPIIALVASVVSIACYILCYFMCTERIEVKESEENISFGATLKALFGNKALIALCIVYICFLGAQMLNQTINNYVFKDFFGNTMGISVLNAAGFAPALILAPLAVPLTRKFGKRELGIFAAASGAISFLALFLMRPQDNMWLYVIINIVGTLGFGLFNLIIWAFVTDVIDDQEVRTGNRDDGTIYAVCSFSRKIGQAIASALGGWALGWIGYVTPKAGEVVEQTQAVKDGIFNIATITPTVLYGIVLVVLLFMYPLTKQKVLDNVETLKARKAE